VRTGFFLFNAKHLRQLLCFLYCGIVLRLRYPSAIHHLLYDLLRVTTEGMPKPIEPGKKVIARSGLRLIKLPE
jgi:hypothetical protein